MSGIILWAFHSSDQIFVLFQFVQKKKNPTVSENTEVKIILVSLAIWAHIALYLHGYQCVHRWHWVFICHVQTLSTCTIPFCWVASDALYLIETVCFLSFISLFHLYGMILSFSSFFSAFKWSRVLHIWLLPLSLSLSLFLCTVFCAVVGPAAFLLLCKVLFCCWFSWG